jgi:4-hydroxy-tetrahydrodipicolinate reductase
MGGGMADMLLKKKGVDIVGAVGRGSKVGKSMFDLSKRTWRRKDDCWNS